MDQNDKRDLMASIIIQSVMIDKLKWLGEHSRKQNHERLEGLLDDAIRDLVTGTYVLVDEMMRQSSIPNLLQVRLAEGSTSDNARKLAPATDSKVQSGSKSVDLDGARSDLSASL